MKEAIGYARVSSEEQAESGLGLEAQRQRIIAFCDMKGLRLAEVYEDAGVSGGKPLSSRPAGSRLLIALSLCPATFVQTTLGTPEPFSHFDKSSRATASWTRSCILRPTSHAAARGHPSAPHDATHTMALLLANRWVVKTRLLHSAAAFAPGDVVTPVEGGRDRHPVGQEDPGQDSVPSVACALGR
jgi:hypothetical protein